WHTIAGLARAGADITLIAPIGPQYEPELVARELRSFCRPILQPRPPRTRLRDAVTAVITKTPVSIIGHRIAAIRDQVGKLLSRETFDLIHAEQLQALANCGAFARSRPIPLVLRSQNVESDLWRQLALRRPGLRIPLMHEARRLEQWEAAAIRGSDAAIALTKRDAARLTELAKEPGKVQCIFAPFPAELASKRQPPLPGEPPIVLFGSSGWLPNQDGTRWFFREIWPTISTRIPGAVLHLFGGRPIGGGNRSVVWHAAPRESACVFCQGSILVVPLRIASGIRVKILEAWARGIAVVATPQAAEGLEATDGCELLLARNGDEFAAAVSAAFRNPVLRQALSDRARALLKKDHDPQVIAELLLALYRKCLPS
ncbi:MAG TPA: glycosyltransferase family 4 protein, partial [Bryobacteraceae bacterium]|nr:glycosyltransferase family 4 protein [Bryobacteraceae bacterium]